MTPSASASAGAFPEIRKYRPGEEEAIREVYVTATRVSNGRDYHPDLIERWATRYEDLEAWRDRLREKDPFVAVMAGGIVGMAEVDAGGEIDYFYVHPAFQGRGVGRALLVAVEAQARGTGAGVLKADVSITAKSFFEANGFTVTAARDNVILGHPAPNFAMIKRLEI